MAIRGENIGTAYVRILADGTGLDRSIRDEFAKADDAMKQSGETHSEKYQEGFDRGLVRGTKKNKKAMLDSLALGRGEMDARAQTIGSNFAKQLRNELRKSVKGTGIGGKGDTTLADTIWNNLMEKFRRTGDEGVFSNWLENLNSLVEDATKQITAEENRQAKEQERQRNQRLNAFFKSNLAFNKTFQQALAKQRKEMLDEAYRMNADFNAAELKDRQDADKQWELHIANLARLDQQQQEQHADMVREAYFLDRDFNLKRQKMLRDAYAMNRDFDAKQREMFRQAYAMNRDFDLKRKKALEDLRDEYALLNREAKQRLTHDKGASLSVRELRDRFKALGDEMTRLGMKNEVWRDVIHDTDRDLRNFNPKLSKTRKLIGDFADTMGAGFGRGSRNDFVNAIGSMVRGMINTLQILPAMTEGFLKWGRSIRDASGPLGKMGAMFGPLIKGVVGLGGAFLVLSPVISMVSLLAGTVAALASTIGMGLIGALGAAAGAFVPFVASIGVGIAAFANLEGEAKRAVKSVGSAFKDLGKAASEGLLADRSAEGFHKRDSWADQVVPEGSQHKIRSFAEQMALIKSMVEDMRPIVFKIGRVIADDLDRALNLLNAPLSQNRGVSAWDSFTDKMDKWLPDAVRKVGMVGTNTFMGMLGLIRALTPITDRFLRWLREVTLEFAIWSNTIQGQRKMKSFFHDAADSAAELAGFLGAVGELLMTLIRSGNEAGDSLFSSMTQTIEGWNEVLTKNPDILTKWYDAAESFGKTLGDLVIGIGKVFDAFDNTFGRTVITGILEGLAGAINGIGSALEWIGGLFGAGKEDMQNFAGSAAMAAVIVPRLNLALTGMATRVREVGVAMATTGTGASRFNTVLGRMSGALRGVALAGGMIALSKGMGDMNKKVDTASGLWTILGGTLTGAAIGSAFGPIGTAVGGAAGAIGGLAVSLKKNGEAMKGTKDKVLDYAATFDTLTGAVTNSTRALVLQDLQKRGAADSARYFGISMRDVVSAAMGERDAIKRVNDAMAKHKDIEGGLATAGMRRKLEEVTETWKDQQKQVQDNIRDATSWKQALQGLPRNIKTDVKAIGMDMTLRDLADLNKKYELTPKQVRTIVKATGMDISNRDLRKLIQTLRETGKIKVNPKVGLDDKGLRSGNKQAESLLDALGRKKPTPKVGLDDKPARSGIADLLTGPLRDLNNNRPKPRASLEDDATPKANGIRLDLNNLGAMSVSPTVSIIDNASSVISSIGRGLAGLASKALNIGRSADGRITTGPMLSLIGEEGPEAVVPLNRPLSQVDPSVRWLSAIAQGKVSPMARGGVAGGRTVHVEQHIYSPQTDARAVAAETVNRLVAVGY